MISAIILDLSHFYSRRKALKLSLSGPGAFLINCLNKALFILFSIIKSFSTFITKSDKEKAISDDLNKSEKSCFIKIATFSLTVIAISLFKDSINGVIEEDLKEV